MRPGYLLLAGLILGLMTRMQAQNLMRPDSTDTHYTYMNKILQPILEQDSVFFTNGILYNRVFPLARLTDFNDSVKVSGYWHFMRAWTELYASSTHPDFLSPDTLSMLVLDFEMKDTIVVGLINTSFTVMDSTALDPAHAKIQINNNGKFQRIQGKNPYITAHVTIMTPLNLRPVSHADFVLDFAPAALDNSDKTISNIRMIDPSGTAYTIVSGRQVVRRYVPQHLTGEGTATYTFEIDFTDGTSLTTYGKLTYKIPDQQRSVGGNVSPVYTIVGNPFPDYITQVNLPGVGRYRIYYANGRSTLQKPFVVVDGFDAFDASYRVSDNSMYVGTFENLYDTLRDHGYDVVLLNFPLWPAAEMRGANITRRFFNINVHISHPAIYHDYATNYIERNARTLESLIRELNNRLAQNGSSEKLCVMGYSMGGLIARYALAEMEQNGENHNTALYISYDSPHLGANIPVGLQDFFNYILTGLDMLGVVGTSIDYYLLGHFLYNPAAQQMLIHRRYKPNTLHYSTFHNRFYTSLNRLNGTGFPENLQKIAVVNGSMTGNTQEGFPAGSNIMELRFTVSLFPLLRYFFQVNATKDDGPNDVFAIELRTYWNIRLMRFATTYTTDPDYGSLDVAPGSYYDRSLSLQTGSDFIDLLISMFVHINFTHEQFAFIPTKSALAYTGNNHRWDEPLACRNLICTGETPFDSYFTDAFMEFNNSDHEVSDVNDFHTFDEDYIQNWLVYNIHQATAGRNVLPPEEIPPYCYGRYVQINGDNTICYNVTKDYSLTHNLTSDCVTQSNWEVSNGLEIVQNNGNDIRVKCIDAGMGLGWISLTLNNGEHIRKYVVSKPDFELLQTGNNQYGTVVIYNNFLPIEDQTDQHLVEIEWDQLNGNGFLRIFGQGTDQETVAGYDTSNGCIKGQVTVTNECGATTKIFFIDDANGFTDCSTQRPNFLVLRRVAPNKYEVINPCKPKSSYVLDAVELYDQYGVKIDEDHPAGKEVKADKQNAQTGEIRIIRVQGDGKTGVKRVQVE